MTIAFHPWDDTMAIAARGNADGVFPAYYQDCREDHFMFSDAFAASPLGLCKRKYFQTQSPTAVTEKSGNPITFSTDPRIDQTQALKDLQGYRYGFVKEYANTPVFNAADFLNKVTADSDADNKANLLRNKMDLIVIDRYVARSSTVNKYPWHSEKIEFMHPPLSMKQLYLAISRTSSDPEKKLSDFYAGLAILIQDGVVERLNHRYGLKRVDPSP